jgi:phosphopantetheinyl transferase (holo-ACP synthase)
MTIELLADVAKNHAPKAPTDKLVRIGNVAAYQWIAVENPIELSVKGVWKARDTLELELVGYAKMEFSFAEEWPTPPEGYIGDIDIGEDIMPPMSAEELYERFAFHGPQYHSALKTLHIAARGLKAIAGKTAGKGSLLDVMGQQLGLFLHLTQTENVISFPIKLRELNFYADYTDQSGVFDHTLIITRLTETAITGDMVLKREGKPWAIARDFVCQRFVSEPIIWQTVLRPGRHKIATEIAPGVYHGEDKYRANLIGLLEKRYLDLEDLIKYRTQTHGSQKRSVLLSRIAIKDAVRDYLRPEGGDMLYPVQINLRHDELGKPYVQGFEGLDETERARLDALCVSLSHKDNHAVAIVAERPVGIDVEKIEEKTDGFIKTAFTEGERAILQSITRRQDSRPEPEDVIRFWVAKEAASKKAGTGLTGDPGRYEVLEAAREGDIRVGGDLIRTIKIGEGYIAGWTI